MTKMALMMLPSLRGQRAMLSHMLARFVFIEELLQFQRQVTAARRATVDRRDRHHAERRAGDEGLVEIEQLQLPHRTFVDANVTREREGDDAIAHDAGQDVLIERMRDHRTSANPEEAGAARLAHDSVMNE